MDDFRESQECKKCGSVNLEVKLHNTYRNGIPGYPFHELKYTADSEDYLRCKCKKCGRTWATKTKDAVQ